MDLPKMCRKDANWYNERAGWHVPNSCVLRDIVPEWRTPGGGVSEKYITDDVLVAYDKAIQYSENKEAEVQEHIRRLRKAKKAFMEKKECARRMGWQRGVI